MYCGSPKAKSAVHSGCLQGRNGMAVRPPLARKGAVIIEAVNLTSEVNLLAKCGRLHLCRRLVDTYRHEQQRKRGEAATMSSDEEDVPLTRRLPRGVQFVAEPFAGMTPWEISQSKAAEKFRAADAVGDVIVVSDNEDPPRQVERHVSSAAQSSDEDDQPLSHRRQRKMPPAQSDPTTAAPTREAASTSDAHACDSESDDAPLTKRRRQSELGSSKAASAGAPSTAVLGGTTSGERLADADASDEEDEAPLSVRKAARKGKGKGQGVRMPIGERATEGESGSESEPDADDDGDSVAVAVAMATEVLARGECHDHEGVLSVLGADLTSASPFEALKQAYRGLAKLIHPDKLGSRFAGATKAFQCLARAFEVLTAPAPSAGVNAGGKRPAMETVGRSNEGCYRTRCSCPRCGARWGGRDSGLAPYEYTLLMQGLKTYHCCGCLFEYGCMSAEQCGRVGFEPSARTFERLRPARRARPLLALPPRRASPIPRPSYTPS